VKRVRGVSSRLLLMMWLLLAGLTGGGGCSGSGSEIVDPLPVVRDFDWIQVEILNRSCVLSCHDSMIHLAGLDLSSPNSYEEIVNVPAHFDATAMLVKPDSSGVSGLLLTLGGAQAWPIMPPGGMSLLSSEEIEIIKAWIDRGAPRFEN